MLASAIPVLQHCSLPASSSEDQRADISDADGSGSESSGPNSPSRDDAEIMTDSESTGTEAGSPAWYASIPHPERHEKLMRSAFDVILNDAVFNGTNRKNPVLEFVDPHEMPRKIDFSLPTKSKADDATIVNMIQQVIRYSVKTGNPRFVNQLYGGLDPYGLIAQWVTDALNPSLYTYEVSPVFTLMEEAVLHEMRAMVGFPAERGDGLFCPGGSIANLYAFSCARHSRYPQTKKMGLSGLPRLVAFTSEDSHYSVKKAASLVGIGADNVCPIRCDAQGRMDLEVLVEQIKKVKMEGGEPFLISATAGTTVLGAFDPIEEIAEIACKNKMWLHVDAAWGGGALMSRKYRHLLHGISEADSITWNPHKLMAAPQQCSVFLTRNGDILSQAHSSSAEYLFQPDKFYDTRFDVGDKHVQCGRRADVFKLWLMWKAKGSEGFEKHIDHVFDVSEYFTEMIRCRTGWELVLRNPECTNVCFWFIPPSLRGCKNEPDYNERLHKVAPKIKERMMRTGSLMLTYQPLRGLPNFFRLVVPSSGTTREDANFIICQIERLGWDL